MLAIDVLFVIETLANLEGRFPIEAVREDPVSNISARANALEAGVD